MNEISQMPHVATTGCKQGKIRVTLANISIRTLSKPIAQSAIALYFLFLLVDGALLQIQMAVTGGHIPLASNSIPICAIVLVGLLIYAGRIKRSKIEMATILLV